MGKFKNVYFNVFIMLLKFVVNEQLINNKYYNVIPDFLNAQKYSHKNNNNLYFIFSLFRHGARAPLEKDLNNNMDILGGIWDKAAEMTSIGRKQNYIIGTKIKNDIQVS